MGTYKAPHIILRRIKMINGWKIHGYDYMLMEYYVLDDIYDTYKDALEKCKRREWVVRNGDESNHPQKGYV
jgi:hypothetical protein|tara:strand:+ start:197 stop:409 length:213 start_codon:yes stop_codon:yes gene_type:complete